MEKEEEEEGAAEDAIYEPHGRRGACSVIIFGRCACFGTTTGDMKHHIYRALEMAIGRAFKGGTICVCGWSANLESKLLAVFCSLRRLLLATLLFEISFNWRIIRDFGIT